MTRHTTSSSSASRLGAGLRAARLPLIAGAVAAAAALAIGSVLLADDPGRAAPAPSTSTRHAVSPGATARPALTAQAPAVSEADSGAEDLGSLRRELAQELASPDGFEADPEVRRAVQQLINDIPS